MPLATPGQSARRLAVLGLASATLVVPIWAGTTQTFAGQRAADLILYGRVAVNPAVQGAATETLATVSLVFVATAALGLVTLALARGGVGLAAALLVVLGGTNLTAQGLKELLDRPNLLGNAAYAVGNSFPSGHVALAASLGLAAVIVAPRRLRAPAAVGAATLVAGVGVSSITAGWHRLADVAGSLLIALAWSSLVTAALVRIQGWMPRRTWGLGLGGGVAALVGGAGGVAVVAGAVGLGAALVDPAPLREVLATRATSPEAFAAALAITVGISLLACAGFVWAMRGVALELPG